MTATFRESYVAFGLTVSSDLELPELPPAESVDHDEPQVRITRGPVDPPADPGSESMFHRGNADEYYLRYDGADVLIRDGREIVVDPQPDLPHEVMRHLVIGPAFNHLLHQRDLFVIHASSVAIGDRAVAFAGDSGQGKTTTAMAFLLAGHCVLSDDVAAIESTTDGPAIRSGFPSMKLDPTVVERFDVPVDGPTRTCPGRERHFHGLRHEQPEDPTPLEAVYVLEDANRFDISLLPPQEQLMELVRNTYAIGTIEDVDDATSHFRRGSDVLDTVAVKRLCRPRRLDALSGIVDRVTEDLRGRLR